MSDELLITIQPKTSEEIFSGDLAFGKLTEQELMEVYTAHAAFFRSESFAPDVIRSYYTSHWQWYVRAAWQLLLSIPTTDVATVVWYTSDTAAKLGIDCQRLFLGACTLGNHALEADSIVADVHTYIESHDRPMTYAHDSTDTLGSYLKAFDSIEQKQEGSLSRSEFFSKVSEALQLSNDPNVLVDEAKQTMLVQDIISYYYYFLLHTTAKELRVTYLRYLDERNTFVPDADAIGGAIQESVQQEAIQQVFGDDIYEYLTQEDDPATDDTTVQSEESSFSIREFQDVSEQTSTPYTTIQTYIIDTYGDITALTPAEIAPVLAYLESQAETQGIADIQDLIYFDSTTNSFVWNQSLLDS